MDFRNENPEEFVVSLKILLAGKKLGNLKNVRFFAIYAVKLALWNNFDNIKYFYFTTLLTRFRSKSCADFMISQNITRRKILEYLKNVRCFELSAVNIAVGFR